MDKKLLTSACDRCGKPFAQPAWKQNSKYRKKTCSPECAKRFWGTLMERYWGSIKKARPSECWEWIAAKNDWGYGRFYVDGKRYYAHRWTYEKFVEPIPKDKILMHSCDNPACVNPAHLLLGTNKENSRDCLNKGRKSTLKLSVAKAKEIRRRLKGIKPTWKQYEALAKEFGVSASSIHHTNTGHSWGWIDSAAQDEEKPD